MRNMVRLVSRHSLLTPPSSTLGDPCVETDEDADAFECAAASFDDEFAMAMGQPGAPESAPGAGGEWKLCGVDLYQFTQACKKVGGSVSDSVVNYDGGGKQNCATKKLCCPAGSRVAFNNSCCPNDWNIGKSTCCPPGFFEAGGVCEFGATPSDDKLDDVERSEACLKGGGTPRMVPGIIWDDVTCDPPAGSAPATAAPPTPISSSNFKPTPSAQPQPTNTSPPAPSPPTTTKVPAPITVTVPKKRGEVEPINWGLVGGIIGLAAVAGLIVYKAGQDSEPQTKKKTASK